MRLLIFISVVLSLASCSTPKELYDKGLDKIHKAIERDSSLVFPQDTLVEIQYDTIPGKDGEPTIIKVKETIQLPCDFDVEAFMKATEEKSNRQLRHERRMAKDSTKHREKMYKLETDRLEDSLSYLKQENRQLTKQLKDSNTKEEKLAKEETKQKKGGWFTRLAGRYWWIIFILGIVLGLYVKSFIPKIPSPFKRNGS